MGFFHSRARSFFKKSKADAFLLFSDGGVKPLNPNFFYFASEEIDGCTMLAKRGEEPLIFTSEMNSSAAQELLGKDFEIITFRKKRLTRALKEHMKGIHSLALDFDGISASRYLLLKRKLRKRFVNSSDIFLDVRSRKDGREISLIRKADSIVKKIVNSCEITRGKKERGLATELLAATLEAGCGPSFAPIVSSGTNSSFPHWAPSEKKLEGCVLIDFGVKYRGYCSDITRCFFLGKCKEEREAYGKLKHLQSSVARQASRIKSAGALVAFANSQLEEMKLPKLIHGLGHGIGLDVHEKPSLRQNSRDRLAEGSVFTIEPGAYFPGKFGVRYENVAVYKNGRAKFI